jgi:hypothetical protein
LKCSRTEVRNIHRHFVEGKIQIKTGRTEVRNIMYRRCCVEIKRQRKNGANRRTKARNIECAYCVERKRQKGGEQKNRSQKHRRYCKEKKETKKKGGEQKNRSQKHRRYCIHRKKEIKKKRGKLEVVEPISNRRKPKRLIVSSNISATEKIVTKQYYQLPRKEELHLQGWQTLFSLILLL